ncbi:Uncharacterised protein [Mycobacteroides abscessus subsp. abscessus]|nr:Uncharacterised protein [Mycobacteroides abscessus subsp. abscessus]
MNPGARNEVRLLLGKLFVLLAPVSSSDRTLFQIALVPAPEDGGQVLCQVQFENVGDAAGQKLTIVTHQHHTTA